MSRVGFLYFVLDRTVNCNRNRNRTADSCFRCRVHPTRDAWYSDCGPAIIRTARFSTINITNLQFSDMTPHNLTW